MSKRTGKMKQSEIAKFYGVSQADVSTAFQMAKLEPMHWDLENAWECLYDLYMKRFDQAKERAYAWKYKATDIECKWLSSRDGIAKGKEVCCGDCEYFNWDKRDEPCCYCTDKSEFVACEE